MRSPVVPLSAIYKALRQFSSNRRGSTAVEFAMVAPLFFALIFAILETALVFFAGQLLEIGTQDAARLIYTNQATAMSKDDFHTNLCNRVSILMSCANVYVDVKSYAQGAAIPSSDLTVPITSGVFDTSSFTYQTSSPGSTVMVRAFYQWPLFVTGLGYNIANIGRGTTSSSFLLSSTAAFHVEPN